MSGLPEELWRRILELGLGVESSSSSRCFNYKDVCCVSMTCTLLNRLSKEDLVWSSLLSSDFSQSKPTSSSSTHSPNPKSIYIIRFKRDRTRKLLAHRRAVLRTESQIAQHTRNLEDIQLKLGDESHRLKSTLSELSNLRKVRQASVALNVWQPEVIYGRQKQIVQHCSVPVDSRINVLEMELKLCKQQISGFHKAHRDENQRLEAAKDQLSSMNYHPLQNPEFVTSSSDESGTKKIKKFRK